MVPFLCCVLGRVVLICSSLLMSEKKKVDVVVERVM